MPLTLLKDCDCLLLLVNFSVHSKAFSLRLSRNGISKLGSYTIPYQSMQQYDGVRKREKKRKRSVTIELFYEYSHSLSF